MIALLAAGAPAAWSQDARPAYEAASVKPNNSGSGSSSSNGSKGQIVFTNVSLKRLIERAYDVKPFQVTSPDWVENLRFDIAAKYPPDTKPEERSLMLRSLLEDRFKLAVHHDSKEMPGFALVVAKGGFKLKPVEPAGGSSAKDYGGRVRTLTAKQTSIAAVADLLARILGETVVDKTGIDGVYDFEFKWTADDMDGSTSSTSNGDPAPSLFTAIQETLGLRLQAQKVPVEIIVVDHVERVPIEN
ncbi:MAG: TIGR03435 family protein [Candidatus Sulfopaludibacter sp.]|nr:TIGR03435 family protein [Candidatus Sulfopaludibacter sp.]